jgi:hypothetical protein
VTRSQSLVVMTTHPQGGVVDKRRILLLGATGYTGQRVLRELLARGQAPTLVGRNRTKMLALADRLEADLPVAEVEVTSTADLARLLEPSDVVLSTVGPFMQLGMATVTAAAQAGAHYLDSAGEGSFVRRVFELDAVAAARGASVVPAFGYDYVPGNLAGALALTRAGERARRIEVGYFLTRSGHGDELRYRSTLRDAFTLTTGGHPHHVGRVGGRGRLRLPPPTPQGSRPAGRGAHRQAGPHLQLRRHETCRADRRRLRASRTAGSLPPAGQRRCVPRLVRTVDPSAPDDHRAHGAPAAVGDGAGRGDAAVPAAPGIAPRAGQ